MFQVIEEGDLKGLMEKYGRRNDRRKERGKIKE